MTAANTRADLMHRPGFADLSADTAGNPCVLLNYYPCDMGHDIEEWTDTWSCACDDDCPICGAPIAPDISEWIGPTDVESVALWERLADK
jgi:hypothetical protein